MARLAIATGSVTPEEMKEISVFLPKDVKSISDNKDFQHIHMMGGRIGVDCVTWILILWQLRDIRIVHICSVRNQSQFLC